MEHFLSFTECLAAPISQCSVGPHVAAVLAIIILFALIGVGIGRFALAALRHWTRWLFGGGAVLMALAVILAGGMFFFGHGHSWEQAETILSETVWNLGLKTFEVGLLAALAAIGLRIGAGIVRPWGADVDEEESG